MSDRITTCRIVYCTAPAIPNSALCHIHQLRAAAAGHAEWDWTCQHCGAHVRERGRCKRCRARK